MKTVYAIALNLPLAALILFGPAIGNAETAAAQNARWQPLQTITDTARKHAETHGMRLGQRQTIEAGPMDERLLFTKCAKELTAAFAPGVKNATRMTVEVRCPGSWRVYVPVKVTAFDRAVITTRALERGHVLTAEDVSQTDSAMSDLPTGYAQDPAMLVGRRVVRSLSAGTVLTPSQLEANPIIHRGDRITAVAKVNGIAIRAQAIALAAGGENERIRIKNVSSGKELVGIVRSAALVEIPLQ